MSKDIELYDNNDDYYHGTVEDNGNIDLYDQSGNYYHGKVKSNGDIDLYDKNVKAVGRSLTI